MSVKMIRIVSRAADGTLRQRDHESIDSVKSQFDQYGVDDCSTDLTLRGYPLFRGLVGPMADGKSVARYETADVFEALTKEWASTKVRRRSRGAAAPLPAMHFNLGVGMGATETV